MKHGLNQEPGPIHEAKLEDLIRSLMPSASGDQHAQALEQVQKAIDAYRESFPVLDGSRRRRSSLKEARKDLRALSRGAEALEPPRTFLAHQALLRAQKATPAPELNPPTAPESADRALRGLADRDDHEVDEYREDFASEIARALRDVIGLPIAMTRDDLAIPSPSGPVAAYARLLRASLLVAGGRPPVDLLPLMRAGMAVLSDSPESFG